METLTKTLKELLTPKQYLCIGLACLGLTNKQIGLAINNTALTITNCFRQIYENLNLQSEDGIANRSNRVIICNRFVRERLDKYSALEYFIEMRLQD